MRVRIDTTMNPWIAIVNGETHTDATIRKAIASLGPLPEPMIAYRCATLQSRSIKGDAQAAGLDLAIACVDLTTLEGADTTERVHRLAARAVTPDPDDPSCPRPAAVCVYPSRVSDARKHLDALGGSDVAVASVAGAFPSGLAPREVRLREIEMAVADGASEIDIVIDRGLLLAGRYSSVFDELRAARQATGSARLKVILETGELGSLDVIRHACWLAAAAGADFLKTSTGKSGTGATPTAAWVLANTAEQYRLLTGRRVGVKISGGVRHAKDALRYMLIIADQLGTEGLHPAWFRIGASSLLDDLCAQRRFHATGRYWGAEYFPAS